MCPSQQSDLAAETFIFVDVDGVLNVGIRDQEDAPLLFNQANKEFALSQQGKRQPRQHDENCVQRLLAVAQQSLPSEEGSYSDLACTQGSHICEALARRLAQVIVAGGERCTVVLSSNWRKPQHANRVRKLEAEVSKHLDCTFTFDARTAPANERNASDRLRCIGDYVESLCGPNGRFHDGRPLRCLLLEDFFITPLNGWACGNARIDSTAAAEAYLKSRASASANIQAKLVHTYHEWKSPTGLRVQIGAGLSHTFAKQAFEFLAAPIIAAKSAPLSFAGKMQQQIQSRMAVPVQKSIEEEVKVPSERPSMRLTAKHMDKVGTAATACTLAQTRLAESITSALPWLAVYLPCAV